MGVQEIHRQFEQLKSERVLWENIWQQVATYCLPNRGFITKGPNIPKEIYDSTAVLSLQILAAGLQGYLVNPSQRWFSLRFKGQEESDEIVGNTWLREVEDIIFDVLSETNFYQQAHEAWLDLGAFGTSCLYSQEDPIEVCRFYARPVFEIFISENEKEQVDTVFRKFEMTARQMVGAFGEDSVPEAVKEAIRRGEPETKFKVVHAVLPNPDHRPDKATQKPYLSLYYEPESLKVLSEGGYYEFPYFVARFLKHSDSVWGFSPAMSVLADIRTLNVIVKDILEMAEMAMWPPIEMPADGYVMPIKLKPRGVVIRNKGYVGEGMKPIITAGNLPVGENEAEKRRDIIRKAFYVDLFLMLAEARQMTATEVVKRIEERMLLLGPVLGRIMQEFLNPLIARIFAILARQGKLPAIEDSLPSQEYSVVYTSPLARAQKLSEITGVQEFLAMVSQVAQFSPDSLDNINFDAIVRSMMNILHIDPRYLNDKETVEQIRMMKAQLAMAQAGGQSAEESQG